MILDLTIQKNLNLLQSMHNVHNISHSTDAYTTLYQRERRNCVAHSLLKRKGSIFSLLKRETMAETAKCLWGTKYRYLWLYLYIFCIFIGFFNTFSSFLWPTWTSKTKVFRGFVWLADQLFMWKSMSILIEFSFFG